MRAIWTGAIGFGLVNIPVKIYSATEESRVDLDMLDKNDHSNIKFQRVNEKTGKVVNWNDIVKGYKYEDEYIILTDEDFAKAYPKKSKTIEILEFIKETEIDSIYFESPYYLEPDKSGERAYALLREALAKSKKVGLASFILRNKEQLAVVKPMEKVMVLNRIRFHEEIRDFNKLDLPDKKEVKGGELDLAMSLIDQLTKKFDLSKYKDTYKEEIMKIIEAKAEGKDTKIKKLVVPTTKAKDLMAQLKASLETAKQAS
ncbi:MAG TPA: Ku protein [Cytophagales bacterium]|nr:Ku protein [Cytophagales bacterium]